MAANPDLMTRWQLKFVPSDWNPTQSRPKHYWKKNSIFLNPKVCQDMENRYLSIDFDPNIIVIDGSIRPENINRVDKFLCESLNLRMIIVDNMETLRPCTQGKFFGFQQYDFNEYDVTKIPLHQNGKWCTSVWIKSSI